MPHLTLKTKLIMASTALALALGVSKGCGDTVEPLLLDLESLQLVIDDISKITERHPREAQTTTSVTAWKEVERRDRGRLAGPMAELNRLLGAMGRMCTGPAGGPDLAPLRRSAEALTAEIQAHAQTVEEATEGTSSPALENQFAGTIPSLVGALREQATSMERQAAAYTCEIHNP